MLILIFPQNTFTALLQLLPVLVLILISVFTQMMATSPPYSLFYKPWVHLSISLSVKSADSTLKLRSGMAEGLNNVCRSGYRAMGLVVSRETQHMGVPYYVDKGFEKVYRGAALDELEKTIESDYIEHLQNGCWKEKQQSKRASDVFSVLQCRWAV